MKLKDQPVTVHISQRIADEHNNGKPVASGIITHVHSDEDLNTSKVNLEVTFEDGHKVDATSDTHHNNPDQSGNIDYSFSLVEGHDYRTEDEIAAAQEETNMKTDQSNSPVDKGDSDSKPGGGLGKGDGFGPDDEDEDDVEEEASEEDEEEEG